MSKKKIAGLAVGGFLALTMIGNAIGSPDKPKPFTPPAVAVSHASKDASRAIKGAGRNVWPICGTKAASYLTNENWDGNCTTPPKPVCGPDRATSRHETAYWGYECRETAAQKRADKRAAAAEKKAEHKAESTPESCAGKAADIGVVKALSGDIGGAVEAGKTAWDEAGTGSQC